MSEQQNVIEPEIEIAGATLASANPDTAVDAAQSAEPDTDDEATSPIDVAQPSTTGTLDAVLNDILPPAPNNHTDEAVQVAVRQTLATLGITSELAVEQRWLKMESLINHFARTPDEIKNTLENLFGVLLERLEDPKGVVGYNRQKRFFLDLLSLHDLMQELEDRSEETGTDVHRSNYRNLKEHLLQLLVLNGVTPVGAQVGAPFNPQAHRVIKITHTEDASQDSYIDSIVREGFAFGSFTLRPTEVVVRKCMGGGNG